MDTAPPPGPAKRPTPPNATPQLFGKPMGGPAVVLLVLLGLAFITILFREQTGGAFPISYDQFIHEVEVDNVANVELTGSTVRGTFKSTPPKERIESPEETRLFTVEVSQYLVGDGLDSLLLKHNVRTVVKQPTDGTGFLLGIYLLIPLLLMGAFWISMRRARDPLGGSGFLGNFTKSPAKLFNAEDKQSTFADVAGLDGVKEDLKEIVEFLKDPKKFQRLGGRVPKGVLLMGPPGTGKTLLAASSCRRGRRSVFLHFRE